jgi:hypothetical protein
MINAESWDWDGGAMLVEVARRLQRRDQLRHGRRAHHTDDLMFM